jgi:hypothetical protein
MPTPIDPDRGLARDGRGNMIWETRDVLIETTYGTFIERQVVGQPNGGILLRQGPGGMSVYMYNDDPGVFLNERGAIVSDAIASQAGFDVASLAKARRRKLALSKAQAGIDAEYATEENSNIIEERGEYRLVEVAQGHFQIHFVEEDGKGSPLSGILTRQAAAKLFLDLAGPAPVLAPEPAGKK